MNLRVLALAFVLASTTSLVGQQPTAQFGGNYSSLDARRQRLVDDWVARFNATTGQNVVAGPFYDEIVSLSTKVTFDAVTNALMQTPLTDAAGGKLGDALSLVEHVDAVHGQIAGAPGDRQFRIYARLTEPALDTLARSNEFKRGADNSVFHKGYPINYRAQGGVPSIQISIARDGRRADVDVDYRSSGFPAGLFNGHLTASNSDVRAGDNYDRHVNRWVGFENWWRSFFGIGVKDAPDTPKETGAIPTVPRAGKKPIDLMVNDFLNAWLVEGNVIAAMGYISQRSYACLAERGGSPDDLDIGMAPFRLMANLKAAHNALAAQPKSEPLTTGVHLSAPTLKVVQQKYHSQFVVYSVPDDLAAAFDCENRLAGRSKPVRRKYGTYFGSTFYVRGHGNNTVALLWARENGYWKIVSWQTGLEAGDGRPPADSTDVKVVRVAADRSFVDAAHSFLQSWLIRKDYDAAFAYLSQRSYACYDLVRGADQPAATSMADAGRSIRAGMERVGVQLGTQTALSDAVSAVEPVHPAVRVMDHPYSRTFTLTSWPTSLAAAADCSARAEGTAFTGEVGSDYGTAFGMSLRLRSATGETPVLRTLWLKENGNWRLTAYDVEVP